MNDWLRTRASRSEGRTARTYVVCAGASVVGYYCLATAAIARASAPGRPRRNVPDAIPAMLIGRLAVDRRFAGRGIGKAMLRDALQRIAQVSIAVGCRAVLVHAIDAEAAGFYRAFGFAEFPDGSLTMLLPIETLLAAIS